VCAGISYALVATTAALTGAKGRVVLPLLAAAAVGIYYWYAAPLIAEALGVGGTVATGIRVVALLVVAVWLAAAIRAPVDARLEAAL